MSAHTSSISASTFIAGVLSGIIPTLILHPLDLVKVRLQVHEGTGEVSRPVYHGFFDCCRKIILAEGVIGLYQGALVNVIGAAASWGFYFFFYTNLKLWMQGGDATKPLGPMHNLVAGAEAGFLTLLLTNPIWVVKTRMCLQYGPKGSKQTMSQAFKSLWREGGFLALYKGFLMGVLAISHGAIQFMFYEEMKNQYNFVLGQSITTKLSSYEYMIFGGLSKIAAACATHPIQVIKSRLQDQHREYRGTMDVIRQMWYNEGARSFYKGLFPALLRVTPANMLTMLVYENSAYYLKRMLD